MAFDAEVAVIGLGAWGSSALWQLAARDVEVLGIERYGPGHALGSSHGGSRMFRITCLEHAGLVPLARRSLELWHALEHEASAQLFHPTGGLLIGPPDGKIAGGTLRAAAAHGIEIERLSPDALRERFPQHAGLAAGHIGVWEPSAGIVRPEAAIRAATGLAVDAGARVLTDTKVTEVVPSSEDVVVRTAARDFRVRQAVITTGSWLPALFPGLPLSTVRMPITWFRPRADPAPFALRRFPVFMRELAGQLILWGNGWLSEPEVKLGIEGDTGTARALDPEDTDRATLSEDWTELAGLLGDALHGFEPAPTRSAVCHFTSTPDGQFVLGRPGGAARLLIAGGCNAHGFKHATGIGEVLADLVQRKDTVCALDFLHPDRFG